MVKFLIVAWVLLLVGCGGSQLSDIEHLNKAKESLSSKQYVPAVIHLKNALQQNSNNIEARYLLGKVNIDLGSGAEAEKELRKAAELGVDKIAVNYYIGKALIIQKKYDEVLKEFSGQAENPDVRTKNLLLRGEANLGLKKIVDSKKNYNEALRLDSSLVDAKIGLARGLILEGLLDKAKNILTSILAENPRSVDTLLYLGVLHFKEVDLDNAEIQFRGVLKNDSNKYLVTNKLARLYLVRVLIAKNDIEQAQKELVILADVERNNEEVKFLEGVIAYQNEKFPMAVSRMNDVLARTPDDLNALLLLSASNYRQKEYEQSLTAINSFVSKAPGYVPANKLKALVLLSMGQAKNAEKLLSPLVDAKTKDVELLSLIGRAALLSKDYVQSEKFYSKAVKEDPESKELRTSLALSRLQSGDQSTAQQELETLIQDDPANIRAGAALIQVYLLNKKFDLALNIADQMILKSEKNPLVLSLKGTVYAEMGDEKQAKIEFLKAMKVKPGYIPAGQSIAAIYVREKDYKSAAKYYEEVLKYNKHYASQLSLAKTYKALGNDGKYKEVLVSAVESFPAQKEPRLLLAREYVRLNDADNALVHSDRGLREFPNDSGFLELAGLSYMKLGKFQNAEAIFDALLKNESTSARAYLYLVAAKKANGDLSGASNTLDVALKKNIKTLGIYATAAEIAIKRNEFKVAKSHILKIKALYPESDKVILLEGVLATAQGDYAKAASYYEKLLLIDQSTDVKKELTRLYWLSGEKQRAFDTAKRFLTENTTDNEMRVYLASMYEKEGRDKDAFDQYRLILKADQLHLIALNNIALLYLKNKDLGKAVEHARIGYEHAPNTVAIQDTYGWALLQSGQNDKLALRLLTDANKSLPGNASIAYHKASALVTNGKKEDAMELLNDIVNLDFPELDEAKKLKANL